MKKFSNLMLFSIIGVALFAVIITVVAVSYAYDDTGTNGGVIMNYSGENNTLSINDNLPLSDLTGSTKNELGEYFEFTVITNAIEVGKINYEINISNVTLVSNIHNGVLNDSQVRVSLSRVEDEKEMQLVAKDISGYSNAYPKLVSVLSKSNYRDDALVLYAGSTYHKAAGNISETYRIRIWVDGDIDVSLLQDKPFYEYKISINVDSVL